MSVLAKNSEILSLVQEACEWRNQCKSAGAWMCEFLGLLSSSQPSQNSSSKKSVFPYLGNKNKLHVEISKNKIEIFSKFLMYDCHIDSRPDNFVFTMENLMKNDMKIKFQCSSRTEIKSERLCSNQEPPKKRNHQERHPGRFHQANHLLMQECYE